MITTLTSKAKDIIVLTLQNFYYRNEGIVPSIRYTYSYDPVSYPEVVVSISSGTYKPLGIGMGFSEDILNSCGYTIAERRGYMVTASVKLEIVCMTTEERQRLLDEILTALLVLEMQTLYDRGIDIIGADFGGEETKKVGDHVNAYSVSISLKIRTEVYYDELVQYIKSIGVASHPGLTVAEPPEINCEP